jgi:hypothetical protein
VRIGPLRERVSVMRNAAPVKVNGVLVPGSDDPEIVRARVSAEVRTATGVRLERVFAASVQANASHVVKVRAGRTWQVRHSDTLVWHDERGGSDRTLQILGVADPDARGREVLIAAMEKTA